MEVVENKVDILISQYSRSISFPFDNYVLTDLSQYVSASNLIDIECNQVDIADNLIDIELEQWALANNLVETQLHQPEAVENLIDIALERYLPGETNEVEIDLVQNTEFDNFIDIDVDHWVRFDNLLDALIAQYTTNNENLVNIELVKRSGILNSAETWISQYVPDETLADVVLNQAVYAENFVDITLVVWIIPEVHSTRLEISFELFQPVSADNLVDLLLDKTTTAFNRVELWLVAGGANWNFASVEVEQIVRVINLADLKLMHRFFFKTYDPGDSPWGEFGESSDEFSWQSAFDDDDDWGWL